MANTAVAVMFSCKRIRAHVPVCVLIWYISCLASSNHAHELHNNIPWYPNLTTVSYLNGVCKSTKTLFQAHDVYNYIRQSISDTILLTKFT